jgi:hypothetical protein
MTNNIDKNQDNKISLRLQALSVLGDYTMAQDQMQELGLPVPCMEVSHHSVIGYVQSLTILSGWSTAEALRHAILEALALRGLAYHSYSNNGPYGERGDE